MLIGKKPKKQRKETKEYDHARDKQECQITLI